MTDTVRQQPRLILGDVKPLVYLAAVSQLDQLLGEHLLSLPDIVVYKATEDMRWPYAPEIAAWLEAVTATYHQPPERITGRKPESHKVDIVVTESGSAHAAAKLYRPARATGLVGTIGLNRWFSSYAPEQTFPLRLLTEFPGMHSLAAELSIPSLTTLDYLRERQAAGHLPDAEKTWDNIGWHRARRQLDAGLERR